MRKCPFSRMQLRIPCPAARRCARKVPDAGRMHCFRAGMRMPLDLALVRMRSNGKRGRIRS
jgi:hypothetical protein